MDYDWPSIRENAIRLFNDVPHFQTENDIIEVFEIRPAFVVRVIEQVAADLHAGKPIRSPWAVVRSRCHGADSEPASLIVVSDAADRDKAVRKATIWIRNAGLYLDRQAELEDALFGDLGMIREFDTPELRAELVGQWQRERPRGAAAELEAEERQARYLAQRLARKDAIKDALAKAKADEAA